MTAEFGGSTLPDWLERRARIASESPAFRWKGHFITYGELHRAVDRTACQLLAAGVSAGDRVAVLMRSGPGFVRLVHAMSRIGASLVPLNIRLSSAELAWQVGDAEPQLLLCDAAMAPMGLEVRRYAPKLPLYVVENGALSADPPKGEAVHAEGENALPLLEALQPKEAPLRRRIDLQAIHTLLYTSGTTGRPKAVMLSYGNHWWSATASSLNLGLQPGDAWLACLPLFHAGGLSVLFRAVIYGIWVDLHPTFDVDAVVQAIDQGDITHVSWVSTMLERVLAARGDKPWPPRLRAVLLGGGPTPTQLLERCRAQGIPAITSYGMTETASQVVAVPLAEAPDREGSAGQPLLPAEVCIGDPADPAPPGEVGEIWVRGPMVMQGYWRRPEANAETLVGGWLRTGDIGYLSEDGRLFVLDRRDDLIVSGGENVYPAEVEGVLRTLPGVAEAVVLPAPSVRWGQVPVAVVVVQPGQSVTPEALRSMCRERLAGYKVPQRFHFVDELPRNAAGKVLRRELRAKYGVADVGEDGAVEGGDS